MRMRRLPLVLLLVLALVVAACSGGDDDDEQAEGDGRAAGTSSSAVEDDATSTTGGDTSSTTTSAPEDEGEDDGATTTTAGGTTRTTAARAATTTAPARTGPQPARPGRYVYSVEGQTRFGASTQPAPSQSTTTVDRPNGSDQRSRTAGDAESEQVLRYRPDGVYLVFLRTSQGGFTTEFRPNPPVLVVPANVAPGRTWNWTMRSTNGQINVKASFRAVRNEQVTIGGTAVQTIVVESTQEITGQVRATTRSTSWGALERSLIVKSQSTTNGSFNNVPVQSERRTQLRSLNPS